MDVLGAAGAALGILSQVLFIIDRARDAIDAQKDHHQQLDDYNAEIKQAEEWVGIVKMDQSLQIDSIGRTITAIEKIAQKLKLQLEEMGVVRYPAKQLLHLFMSSGTEKRKLDTILRRMTNAKIDLIVRVQFELIGLNREIQTAVNLRVERIEALDARLSELSSSGSYPKLTILLQSHTKNCNGTITVTKEDLEKLLKAEGVALQPEKGERAKKNISDNILGKKAFVITGPQGQDIWEDDDVSITRNIVDDGAYAMLHGQKDLRALEIMADAMVKVAEAENSGGRKRRPKE